MRYVAVIALLLAGGAAEAQQLAFPGAVGYGRYTVGGRGGAVYEVTTLLDAVPAPVGSLRACIEATGPRTCVFRVTGTIITAAALTITNPYITIAGQTAPAPGIMVQTGCALAGSTLRTATSEIIIRFVRFFADQRRCGTPAVSRDALQMGTAGPLPSDTTNIMVDHVSTRFGADENIDSTGACNITIQWSNMAWGLEWTGRTFEDGTPEPHSKGLLLHEGRGVPPWTGWEDCGVTLAYSILANANDRMPEISRYLQVQVINNLIHHAAGGMGEYRSESQQVVKMTQIGNVAKAGPETDTSPAMALIDLRPVDSMTPATAGDAGTFQLYMLDNLAGTGTTVLATGDDVYLVGTPHAGQPPVPAYPAASIEALLPTRAGSSLFQDAADRKLIIDVARKGGIIVDAPDEVTLPIYQIGKMAEELWMMPARLKRPQPDSDRDGMPDWWEDGLGLDPLDPADGAQVTPSGYTNLEEYLNALAAPAFPPPP